MAWTTPATYSVAEVVTASKLNTHIRDNLNYLKGAAGAVAFEDEITITNAVTRKQTLTTSGQNTKAFLGLNGGQVASFTINRDPTSGTFSDTGKAHAVINLDGSGTASFVTVSTANAANTLATERMRITGDGKVGMGRTAPQGRLHGYDTISGFLHWEGDNVGASATVIPDGAGDVIYALVGHYVVRESTGGVQGGTVSTRVPGGATLVISADGALTISVAANGSVVLTRGAGTATYDVGLWLLWI